MPKNAQTMYTMANHFRSLPSLAIHSAPVNRRALVARGKDARSRLVLNLDYSTNAPADSACVRTINVALDVSMHNTDIKRYETPIDESGFNGNIVRRSSKRAMRVSVAVHFNSGEIH